jgi:hypothetical protein
MADFQLSDDFVKSAVMTWQDLCEQGFDIRAAEQWKRCGGRLRSTDPDTPSPCVLWSERRIAQRPHESQAVRLIRSFTDDQQYRRDSGLNHLRLRIRTSDRGADA